MVRSIPQYILLFVLLILAQVLICNHILLFGFAMPIIFIYLIIRLPMSTSVSLLLTIAFISGVIVDIFTDTPGINAASCTILAILRRPIYNLYTGSDEAMKELTPSISSLGIWTYIKFVLSLTVVYCATSFCLVYFSFVNIGDLAARVASSALLSFLVILGIDSLIIDRRDKKL